MFKNLSNRLSNSLNKLRRQHRLTDNNIENTLREIRISLLEADVALPVVKKFITRVKDQALGKKVYTSLTPGQSFVSIVREELENALGKENKEINLSAQPPVVILIVGLQGCGKTTTTNKLAKFLKKEHHNKKVMVVSTDIYRPAAIEQLQVLADSSNLIFYDSLIDSEKGSSAVEIAHKALKAAERKVCDILIVDTAGRLHIDKHMMSEAKALKEAMKPTEILFVVDSMMGQDAAKVIKMFNDALSITGIILTKVDGDSRGGAALSIKEITGKPIKFIGTGEKSDDLKPFYPGRIASRIIGMGDVLSLIEELGQRVNKDNLVKFNKKIKEGKRSNLEDFKDQLHQMKKIGGVSSMIDKLPQTMRISVTQEKISEKMLVKMDAIISSMTNLERQKPEIIRSSRKLRISKGSGTEVKDINRLLKQFLQTQKIMKKMNKNNKKGKMSKMMDILNYFPSNKKVR